MKRQLFVLYLQILNMDLFTNAGLQYTGEFLVWCTPPCTKVYGLREVYLPKLLENVTHDSQAGDDVTHSAQIPFFTACIDVIVYLLFCDGALF